MTKETGGRPIEESYEGIDEWTSRNKKTVRSIYGGIVGLAIIVGAYNFGQHVLEDGHLTVVEAVFVGGLAISGFVAAMPWVFMSLVHDGLNIWQKRRQGGGK